MTDSEDAIPTVGTYRHVGLHDQQSEARLAVVRAAIDAVFATSSDPKRLLKICADPTWPPESRLLAAALLEAMLQIAADERKVRPDIDLAYVRACVAGVNSVRWRDPRHYASLLDRAHTGPGQEGPVLREVPLR
ncbi:hypothetical protein RX327_20010 [Bradyrhizobium sp. BEA-2-5]|uniref:hypothetical protein n=1 Tax=Bradyrhizobium sp. BEA-2-5 TaxID=3080015 RepID=UPI00293E1B35|nr:hypothetical protein [Bradyrhizobium sp. BEA-2-5]WOH78255.1 hypothetical protein RX327_20010 [Bradyrhizobium sp. BEA-2-5]